MYTLQNYITKLKNGKSTPFLDPKEQRSLQQKLKKVDYQVYKPYKDSEKNILYTTTIPKVILYEIKTKQPLRHQEILGTIHALNIKSEIFGDIIIQDNHYYIYVLEQMKPYFETNFLTIKNTPIELVELPIETLENYERSYEEITMITSSTRIDTVIASLITTSRQKAVDKIKNKEVFLNYEIVTTPAYLLKENDIFSIRKYGKFKYKGIIKKTKKDNILICCQKYT